MNVDVPFPPGDDSTVKWTWIFIAFFLLKIPTIALAQAEQSTGDDLHVYLITLGPGSDPWEKFGHDFIDIEDPTRELIDRDDPSKTFPDDWSYNWGVFDFGHGISGFASFGWHFLQGKLVYSMDGTLTAPMVDYYVHANRYVLKQELELTSKQKLDLLQRLKANDTNANRYYLYDYFVKNCATMTRDAIDQTVGGSVRDALLKMPTGTTLRWHVMRCTADDAWLYVFLDYALGHAVDQPLSAWAESFLPMKLAGHLRDVKVPGRDGKMVPFVKSEQVLNAGMYPQRSVPPGFFFYDFLGTGVGFGGLLFLLAVRSNRSRAAAWGFQSLATIWSLLAGFLGTLLCLVWLTDHQAAKWNENWFEVNVLSLLLVLLIPTARRWPRAARTVAFVVVGLSAFDLLMKVTPWFYQVNGSIIAVALPIHAAVAWGLVRLPKKPALPASGDDQSSASEVLGAA